MSCLPHKGVQKGSAPSLVKPPSIHHTESGSLILEMEVKGDPAPTVTWKFNSKPLISGDRISTNMVEKSGVYTISMEISHVSLADVGEYQVVVENTHGKTTFTLTVDASTVVGMNIVVCHYLN